MVLSLNGSEITREITNGVSHGNNDKTINKEIDKQDVPKSNKELADVLNLVHKYLQREFMNKKQLIAIINLKKYAGVFNSLNKKIGR